MNWEHHLIVCIVLFALGAAVGSFVNVCIYRVPRGLNVIRPRSHCPGCLASIAFWDNIPIVSWLALRGRCRRCGSSIPWRYLLVEALIGLLPVASYLPEFCCPPRDPCEGGLLALACRLVERLSLLALLAGALFLGRQNSLERPSG